MKSALKSMLLAAAILSTTCLSVNVALASHSPFQTGQDSTKKGKIVKIKKGKKMKMKRDTAGNKAKQDSVR